MKKYLGVLFSLIMFSPLFAHAAVSQQSANFMTAHSSTGLNQTYQYTSDGSPNQLLVVSVTDEGGDSITSVTANGTAMTQVIKRSTQAGYTIYEYALQNPSVGTHDIVISRSNNLYSINSSAVIYNGAGMPDVSVGYTGTNLTPTFPITTLTDGSWVVLATFGGTPTAGTNMTRISIMGGDTNKELFDTNGAFTPAGTYSVGINYVSGNYATLLMTIPPLGAGGSNGGGTTAGNGGGSTNYGTDVAVAGCTTGCNYSGTGVPSLVYVGDSMTAGAGASPYPNMVGNLPLWNNNAFTTNNIGVSGRTLQTMSDDAPTNLNPLFNTNSSENIAVIWGGTNDLAGGTSVDATFQLMKTFGQTERALGVKVIVVTLASRNGYDTVIDQYNTLLRTYWNEFADGIVDVGLDANIGRDGAYANTTYYQGDGVHLNNTGYGIVANLVQTAITDVVNGVTTPIYTTGGSGGSTPPSTSTTLDICFKIHLANNVSTLSAIACPVN